MDKRKQLMWGTKAMNGTIYRAYDTRATARMYGQATGLPVVRVEVRILPRSK
jgi:hypothetical protein